MDEWVKMRNVKYRDIIIVFYQEKYKLTVFKLLVSSSFFIY